jgi:hypothetical protein
MIWMILVVALGCAPPYETEKEACVAALIARCECGEGTMNGYSDCVNAGEDTDEWAGCEGNAGHMADSYGVPEEDRLAWWACVAEEYEACGEDPWMSCLPS